MPKKTEAEPTFKGSELIRAVYGTDRDILRVVLKPDKFYTKDEALQLTNKFLNKKVTNDARRKLDDTK